MNAAAAMHTVELLIDLAAAAVRAIRSGKPERVAEIVPPTLRTTIAKALADAKAAERFGDGEPESEESPP